MVRSLRPAYCQPLQIRGGTTALFAAGQKGNADVCAALLSAGASVNLAKKEECVAPLLIASYYAHLRTVEILLAAGADANQLKADDGTSPLFAACSSPSEGPEVVETVRALIAAGADVQWMPPGQW